MHKAIARNEGAILHDGMSAKKRAVGNNAMIANQGVMANMAVRHQEVIRPETSRFRRIIRTVYGRVLADNIIVTDHNARLLALEPQILREVTDHNSGVQ